MDIVDLLKEMSNAGVLWSLSFDQVYFFHFAGAGDFFVSDDLQTAVRLGHAAWKARGHHVPRNR